MGAETRVDHHHFREDEVPNLSGYPCSGESWCCCGEGGFPKCRDGTGLSPVKVDDVVELAGVTGLTRFEIRTEPKSRELE